MAVPRTLLGSKRGLLEPQGPTGQRLRASLLPAARDRPALDFREAGISALSRDDPRTDPPVHHAALIPWLDPNVIIHGAGPWALAVVLFIIFAETGLLVGFLLPGDTLLIISGLLTHTVDVFGVNIWVVCALISLAAFLGAPRMNLLEAWVYVHLDRYVALNLGEQALYLAQLKGLDRARAMELIKEWFVKLEMQSWWNKKVEDLSKGMSQKLQFVTTVLHQPRLIILDEPFSGLDPVNSNVIKEEMFNLARNGATIIFSTHRMEQVEEICDHIVLVNQGRKILDGTVKDVRRQFKQHLFHVGFAEAPAAVDAPSFDVVRRAEDGSLTVKMRDGQHPNEILRHFLDRGAAITSFHEILPSINDIFIQLVEGKGAARQFQTVNA